MDKTKFINHLPNSRTVKVFASCRTAVLILVFTLTLAQKFEISNLKLSLINSLSFIQSTYKPFTIISDSDYL
jgi:hypothetical protein